MISFQQAYTETLSHIRPLEVEWVPLDEAAGQIAGEALKALVDSPSADVSLKDGYAVRAADVAEASPEAPVSLEVVGRLVAGGHWEGALEPGRAVRILSGAPLPQGAQAVVAEEFTRLEGERVVVSTDAHPGRNVLPRGSDVARGQLLVSAGQALQPGQVGLLAAGGQAQVPVRARPRVTVLATGDEVVAPGAPLPDGKLYASNLVTLSAWCRQLGMQVETWVERDLESAIRARMLAALPRSDALLTSGGSWKGDRDLVVHVLDALGWEKIYHRVRIGPGKAVGFGLYQDKPVFCLPGGPPSNYMAFLNLALPGLMALAGYRTPGLGSLPARLVREVRGQIDWTQFVQGEFERREGELLFHPLRMTSRLQEMARAQGILTLPEGRDRIPAGEMVAVKVLAWPLVR